VCAWAAFASRTRLLLIQMSDASRARSTFGKQSQQVSLPPLCSKLSLILYGVIALKYSTQWGGRPSECACVVHTDVLHISILVFPEITLRVPNTRCAGLVFCRTRTMGFDCFCFLAALRAVRSGCVLKNFFNSSSHPLCFWNCILSCAGTVTHPTCIVYVLEYVLYLCSGVHSGCLLTLWECSGSAFWFCWKTRDFNTILRLDGLKC